MAGSGHFCPHGNLRYSCAKCREERRARRGPIVRKEYGQKLGPQGQIPAKAWRMDQTLQAHEQAAVHAMSEAKNGVVALPAPLGLRRVAFALLRSIRRDVDAVVFLVPAPRAVEAWADALASELHVPHEDIDDQGRAVRDWNRLRQVHIWTPEAALRNASGLRQHAKRLALFVDSPDAASYEPLTGLFHRPFARRVGVMASRLDPNPPHVWPRLDALGGVVHRLSIQDATRQALLRQSDHRVHSFDGDEHDRADTIVDLLTAARGESRSLVWVDDPGTGRLVEEAASAAGCEARFVGDAASAELAQRAAKAVREGPARVLVRTVNAPPTPVGSVARVIHAADTLSNARATSHAVAHLVGKGGTLAFHDVVPLDAPDDPEDAAEVAARVLTFRAAFAPKTTDAHIPDWCRSTHGLPGLPAPVRDALPAAAADGWQATQALLGDLLANDWNEATARAVLADAYVAARLDTSPVPLGRPPRAHHDTRLDPLAGPFATRETLPALALNFPAAIPILGALLRGDLRATLQAYADAPLIHHLVPDARRLLVASIDALHAARLPAWDADAAAEVAATVVRRGGTPAPLDPVPYKPATDALAAEPHLTRLLAGIDAERAHEIEESIHEIARMSGMERQRQGRTLLGLDLESKRRTDTGLELTYALPTRPGQDQAPLPYTDLTPGALVDLSTGDHHDPILRATVSRVGAHRITVTAAEDRERRAPGRGTRIDQVGNPRVYDALARAVRTVYGTGDHTHLTGPGGLRAHLLQQATGETQPDDAITFFSDQLNESQQHAVQHALAAPRLALIHGPPGTGKTTTLVEYIQQEVSRGHRVLVTADSNAAVDAVLDAYQQAGGTGIRLGPRPSLTRAHLVDLHIDTLQARAPGIDWLHHIPVVFTTHVSSGNLPRDLAFDVVVQDEASQATEAASCLSLRRAPKLVLAGDHLQLPPVVRADDARDAGMATSLFERMHDAYGDHLGRLLTMQYRMHADIEAWSNRAFYDGRIETAVDPPPVKAAVDAGLLPETPRALFVPVAGAESTQRTSKERKAEADWIADRVRRMLAAGVRPGQIAVIAAYRAQVRLLRTLLEGTGVDVGTIDAFQGSERDIVFVSLVRGNPRGEVGFVRDPRRLNVAATRARRHLVVVGDEKTLAGTQILRSLLETLGRIPPA